MDGKWQLWGCLWVCRSGERQTTHAQGKELAPGPPRLLQVLVCFGFPAQEILE